MDSSFQSMRERFSKRHRESDKVLDESCFFASLSCKRQCGETLPHRDLLDLLETDDIEDNHWNDDYWDKATQEELICGVMRSLEEEISASDCSDFSECSMEGSFLPAFESSRSSLNEDGSPTSKSCIMSLDSPKSFNGSDEIGFLLEASDDELGISSSLFPEMESCVGRGSDLETISLKEHSVVDMESWQSKSDGECTGIFLCRRLW
ncbi:hypothetical protein O6H91_13G037400 [Diphasiastrum complanatum]|uniref:Uncharacterized protein n=1 Tax=Diphasiastrum complanatum TaxID=34168 RepID=A0ACC2BTW7_DIPCM|nr:hypothetical protein O6H91_13G037400 [Diphasiastrum complanatum]